MTLEERKELLKQTGLQVAYRAFQEKKAPPLPFICHLETGSNNFFADGKVYQKANRWRVELYMKDKDEETEKKVEDALSEFCWQKEENYIDSEKCYQIVYEMEV